MRLLTALATITAIAVVSTTVASAAPSDRSSRDKWAKKQSADPQKSKSKPKYKPWGEVTKDAEKQEGFINVYRKREDVYFEIKEDQFGKPMVNFMNISSGIGRGWVLGGMPLGILESVMFDFNRVEDHVQVRRLNPRFSAGGDTALEAAVDLSYGKSILASLPIASENKDDKSVLIKVNKLFLSDISDIGDWLRISIQRPVRLDGKKGAFGYLKTFPENIELEAMLTYSPMSRRGLNLPQVPDSRYIEVGVRYSIRMLPEEPMKPRFADDRIGYYMSPHKNFSKDATDNFFVYYINRWRLEKENASERLAEPIKPIVYYIDTTIPEQYRPYVKEGVEMWQKAFEAAGFKNAIIAKDVGEDPDYNAEDSRYNTIRWIVSDVPSFGAIGPHRTDPRTGEILESDILMEQSMIAGYRKNYRRYAGPDPTFANDPILMFLKDPTQDPEAAAFMEIQKKLGYASCDMGMGMATGVSLMQIAILMDTGMDTPEEYVGAAIAEVTAHEVGHGLGLRHNFKSSTATPYDKLHDNDFAETNGLTGSVMDYGAVNVARDRGAQGHYWSPSVGTYDQWVIRYGYSQLPGDMTPEEEYAQLHSIAKESPQKINTYGTDEDTYPAAAMDPDCMIWDLSDDPLAWSQERLDLCQDILTSDEFIDRVVVDGDNYVPLRNAVTTLLIQEYLAASRSVRYVGAYHTARPHRGDGGGEKPMTPVSRDEQEAAMNFLTSNVFAKDAFTVSPELLDLLMDNKLRNWASSPWTPGRRYDFPLALWVGGIQNATMRQLLNPVRLQRMVDMQYNTADAYSVADMLNALSKTIWYENMTPSGRTAVMQRNLQNIYLNYLTSMVRTPALGAGFVPADATSLARLHLTRIKDRIDRAYQQSGLDDETNAHLLSAKARIDRTLEARSVSAF